MTDREHTSTGLVDSDALYRVERIINYRVGEGDVWGVMLGDRVLATVPFLRRGDAEHIVFLLNHAARAAGDAPRTTPQEDGGTGFVASLRDAMRAWGYEYLRVDPGALDELASRLPDGDGRNGSSTDRAYLRAVADRIREAVGVIERLLRGAATPTTEDQSPEPPIDNLRPSTGGVAGGGNENLSGGAPAVVTTDDGTVEWRLRAPKFASDRISVCVEYHRPRLDKDGEWFIAGASTPVAVNRERIEAWARLLGITSVQSQNSVARNHSTGDSNAEEESSEANAIPEGPAGAVGVRQRDAVPDGAGERSGLGGRGAGRGGLSTGGGPVAEDHEGAGEVGNASAGLRSPDECPQHPVPGKSHAYFRHTTARNGGVEVCEFCGKKRAAAPTGDGNAETREADHG